MTSLTHGYSLRHHAKEGNVHSLKVTHCRARTWDCEIHKVTVRHTSMVWDTRLTSVKLLCSRLLLGLDLSAVGRGLISTGYTSAWVWYRPGCGGVSPVLLADLGRILQRTVDGHEGFVYWCYISPLSFTSIKLLKPGELHVHLMAVWPVHSPAQAISGLEGPPSPVPSVARVVLVRVCPARCKRCASRSEHLKMLFLVCSLLHVINAWLSQWVFCVHATCHLWATCSNAMGRTCPCPARGWCSGLLHPAFLPNKSSSHLV
jgi:hypothetical protein